MANVTNDGNQTIYEEFYCYEVVNGIHQQAFILTLNILISVAAFLGNALIIAALPKVSSLHPSSKLLLSCLVWSDLGVGLISEPFYIIFILSSDHFSLDVCFYSDIVHNITAVVFCGVSIQTITAISVDRLLALSLGLRYRQIVTIRRVRVFVIMSWILSSAASLTYLFNELIYAFITCIALFICVTVSTYCYTRIYLTLRHHHSQVHDNIHQEPPSEERTPMNIARYRKTVSGLLWIQVSLLACYIPYIILSILATALKMYPPSLGLVWELTFVLLMFNSSLNPILYWWKIAGVRQAVIETIRKCFH